MSIFDQPGARESHLPSVFPPVEIVEFARSVPVESSTNSTRAFLEHPVPADSILADFLEVSRTISEAPDSFSIAPMLAVCAKALTPRCWWSFGGKKFLNLYQFVVGPPGVRKSTSFRLAEEVARRILPKPEFLAGSASDSALFDIFSEHPHRLMIESEANGVVENWRGSHCGREVAARFLRLYDGDSWQQNYRRHAENQEQAEERTPERFIPCATLSACFGATFNVCRFGGLASESGLRRRFGYYLAVGRARSIDWPETVESLAVESLAKDFAQLLTIEGVFQLDPVAKQFWSSMKGRIDKASDASFSDDAFSVAMQSAYSEACSRVLKLAGVFRACQWVKSGKVGDALIVGPQILEMAEQHEMANLQAVRDLERVAKRHELREQGETILAVVQKDYLIQKDAKTGLILLTRSELTRKFAANGSKRLLTSARLHQEIIPEMEVLGWCKRFRHEGKEWVAFRPE